jgi:hypothetical protein
VILASSTDVKADKKWLHFRDLDIVWQGSACYERKIIGADSIQALISGERKILTQVALGISW